MSYKEDINPRFKSKSGDELLVELQELMTVCCKNLYHAQEFQKQAYDKGVKPKSYTSGDKVWLNSKYLKTKQNRKLEAKFFGPFRVLHPIGKQAYKFELQKKWTIHNVFHVSLLEQDITRKKRVKKISELDVGDKGSEEYKLEAIRDSAFQANESELGHLAGLYYLVAGKVTPRKKILGNYCQPFST